MRPLNAVRLSPRGGDLHQTADNSLEIEQARLGRTCCDAAGEDGIPCARMVRIYHKTGCRKDRFARPSMSRCDAQPRLIVDGYRQGRVRRNIVEKERTHAMNRGQIFIEQIEQRSI